MFDWVLCVIGVWGMRIGHWALMSTCEEGGSTLVRSRSNALPETLHLLAEVTGFGGV